MLLLMMMIEHIIGRMSLLALLISILDIDRLGITSIWRHGIVEMRNSHLGHLLGSHDDESDATAKRGRLVTQQAHLDHLAVLAEQLGQLLLVVRRGYVADVQVRVLRLLAVGTRVRHFQSLVLDLVAVERVYGLLRVVVVHVLDEPIAEAVTQTIEKLIFSES